MGCASSRQATEVSSFRFQEARVERDSLREEISQNLEENLTEHEVITETVMENDSVKTVRVTERVRSRDKIATNKTKKEEVRVVRDTVYVERVDTVLVKSEKLKVKSDQSGETALHRTLKWIVALIIALCVLIIIVKVSSFKF